MPRKLTLEEALDRGILFSASEMENGEGRYRLMRGGNNSGFGYILTEMPDTLGGWQKSHFHRNVLETYIVQKGWIGYVELSSEGEVTFSIYHHDQIFTTQVGIPHNVYMPPGAVIHTIKHGDCSESRDWHPSIELDEKVLLMTETDLFLAAGLSSEQVVALKG